jgi:hypothetical protein
MGARACVGLPPGARRPIGPDVRGACFWEGQFLGWLFFFGSCGNSLLLAENYNLTTTNNTTEAQSAQRLHGGGRNSLRLDDPCELRASPPGQPIDRAAILTSDPPPALGVRLPGTGPSGLHRSLPGGRSCVLPRGRVWTCRL